MPIINITARAHECQNTKSRWDFDDEVANDVILTHLKIFVLCVQKYLCLSDNICKMATFDNINHQPHTLLTQSRKSKIESAHNHIQWTIIPLSCITREPVSTSSSIIALASYGH